MHICMAACTLPLNMNQVRSPHMRLNELAQPLVRRRQHVIDRAAHAIHERRHIHLRAPAPSLMSAA